VPQISYPVTDLKASIAFYEAIGFENNTRFADDIAACLVWSDFGNISSKNGSQGLSRDQSLKAR
jgi:predicted lactoylglutathione lyase